MNSSARFVAMALLATAALTAGNARANYTWNVASGDWSTPGNWTPHGTPTINDYAYVAGGTADVTTNNDTCDALLLGTGAGSGTVYMSAGSLTAGVEGETIGWNGIGSFIQVGGTNSAPDIMVGNYGSGSYTMSGGYISQASEFLGSTAAGAFTQSGGTNAASGLQLGDGMAPGSYTLSGSGLLSTSLDESIGVVSVGTFSQSGGINLASGGLIVGNNAAGTYTLYAGSLSAGSEAIGSGYTGNFTQSAGTNTTPLLYVGYSGVGSYSLSGAGVLNVTTSECIGYTGTGSFTQSGGTHSINENGFGFTLCLGYNSGASGSYTLNGPGLLETWAMVVGNSGAGSFTQSAGTTDLGGTLWVGFESGSGTCNLTGGLISAAVAESLGGNFSGAGVMAQSGGSNNTGTLYMGASSSAKGYYALSGSGALTVTGVEDVGGNGQGMFTQSAGTNTTPVLYLGYGVGSVGTYSLSGAGVLNVTASEYLGYSGSGSFTQSAGTNTTPSLTVALAYSGAYNLGGSGVLIVSTSEVIGGLSAFGDSGTGSFTQSAGTHTTPVLYLGYGVVSAGSYSLSGAGLLNVTESEYVGYSGSGSFTQSGGTHKPSSLYVGYNASAQGTYTLGGGGQLSVMGVEQIGAYGTGQFIQNGGSNLVFDLELAALESSTGSYSQSGGVLSANYEYIGTSGSGSFAQSAGTNSVSGNLVLAYAPTSTGVYNLYGGLLSMGSLTQGGGSAAFNLENGTFQAASSFATTVPINLIGPGSGAIFDTNGHTLELDGGLLGPGGFQKIGQGALILTTANYLTAPIALDAGGLVADNGNQWSATGNNELLLNGGILSAGSLGGTIHGLVQAGSGPHTIAPGYGLAAGQYGTLNLLDGLTTNPYTTLLYQFNSGSVLGTGSNGYSIYGGDLINLGGSSLTVGGGSIALVTTPSTSGDYRLFANPGSISGLTNFSLPGQIGVQYALSTTADSGYIDLVVTPFMTASGGTWIAPASGSWYSTSDWSCHPAIPTSGTVVFPDYHQSITVTLDGTQWADTLVFNTSGSNGYTLAAGAGGVLGLGVTGAPAITVNGGNHTISAPLVLSASTVVSIAGGASLQLSGAISGTSTSAGLTLGGPGLLVVSGNASYAGNTFVNGGTLQFNPGSQLSNSFYELAGGAGNGSVVQLGGNNSPNVLGIGYDFSGSGSFCLRGGLLQTNDSIIGSYAPGTLAQSGGTHDVGTMFLGFEPSGVGVYNLCGGSVAAGTEYLGYTGTGTFNQSGGTNTVSGALVLAYQVFGPGFPNPVGNYNLNGGLLSVGGLMQGAGAATFNAGGGTLQAGASFATSLPIALTTSGNNLTVDTNGNSPTFSGAITGPGGLQVAGMGSLTLTASNGYTGPTTVNAGMLVVANGAAGAAISAGTVTLNGGTLSAGNAGDGSNSGTILAPVVAGAGAHTIAPGAALSPSYGTLNLLDGLTTNANTTLLFNFDQVDVLGMDGGGNNIYGGDLINVGSAALNLAGGAIALVNNVTAPGDYRLFYDTSAATLGAVHLPFQSGYTFALSTTAELNYIDLVATPVALASGGTWAVAANGSWADPSKWTFSPPTVAIPANGMVYFPDYGTSIAITLDGAQSADALVFNTSGTNGYTLATGLLGSTLTLGVMTGSPTITVQGGNHAISAPVVIDGPLTINIAAGAALQLSGALSESPSNSGYGLTLGGQGLLVFSGTGSYTGDTTVSGGTLQINPGAQLPANNEYIGGGMGAAVVQAGGTHAVSNTLYIGYYDGDSGTYQMNGGLLDPPLEYVGWYGSAVFTQYAGTHSVGSLWLAEYSTAVGTYNLNGGLLSLSSLSQGIGAAAFNFGGGTLQAAGATTLVSVPILLSTAGSNAVFDTNGNQFGLEGAITGPGGLQAAGSGTLILAVSNNYTGTTLVANGTLLLGDSNALSGSTFDTSGAGTLSFGGLAGASFGGLQGSGNLLLTNAVSTDVALNVGLNGDDTTFSGSLSDSDSGGSLTKVGTGTLVLSGTNTYGGGTFVEGGALIVTNNEGLADGSSLTVGDPSLFAAVIPDLAASGITPSSVPEPSALALCAAGIVFLVGLRRRKVVSTIPHLDRRGKKP